MYYEPHITIPDNKYVFDTHVDVIDWSNINKLYKEYSALKKEKDKRTYVYQTSELVELSYFVPYKQVLEIYKESNCLYGAEKWSNTMLDRLCNVDSYNIENYIDVTNIITHTHNWSRIGYNLNKYIDTYLLADIISVDEKDNIKRGLLAYDMTDITLLSLASTQLPNIIKLIKFNMNMPIKTPYLLSSKKISNLSKTGKINFLKSSKNRRPVIIRNKDTGQVFMHPKLYHYWHNICSSVDFGTENTALITYITNNLRITNIMQFCHFCRSIRSNIYDYYDGLCWECGYKAWIIRNNPGHATGIRACVTGCRHTVGYFITLELLRRGADFVLGTTRYPNIALETYKQEPDYKIWSDKLLIIGVDFLKWSNISELISALEKYQINTYINNAFQTMPNTPDYLIHAAKLDANPELLRTCNNLLDHNKNIKPLQPLFELGIQDTTNTEPKDSCDSTITLPIELINSIPKASTDIVAIYAFGSDPSWKKPITDISPEEIITAGIVNSIVPEMIIAAFRKMKPNLNNGRNKFQAIISVGSSEGLNNVQSSIAGGHKNHMLHLINCLRLENDKSLIAYVSDPGFITGIFGKRKEQHISIPLLKTYSQNTNTEINTDINTDINANINAYTVGLSKVLTAQDGAMRVIYPLLDYIEHGIKPELSYR